MLEVQVVTSANRHLLADRLDEYARARSWLSGEAGCGCAGHDGDRTAGPLEPDDAVYLLGYLRGRFVSGARLRPCSASAFGGRAPSRCAGARGGLDGGRWAEWTRLFTIPSALEGGHGGVTGAMCCAVMEYCVDEGIRWVGGPQEAYWLTRWAEFGWDVEVLDLPERVDGNSRLAAFMKVSERNLKTVRAATGVTGAQIVHVGPRKPFLSTPASWAGRLPEIRGIR